MRAWRVEEAPLEALDHIALGVGEPASDRERGQAGEPVKEAASTIVAATRSKVEREAQAQEAFDDAMFTLGEVRDDIEANTQLANKFQESGRSEA